MKDIRTIPEAAKECGIPYTTLLRLVNLGEVRVLSIPGRRSKLIDMADLDTYLEGCKSGSIGGSISDEKLTNMAQNEQSQKPRKRISKRVNSNWQKEFSR